MRVLVEGLSKGYRQGEVELHVLRDLNWEFPERRSTAIIGRSGTGKSTFLQLLAGLDTPDRGRVLYGDTDIFALRDDGRSSFRGKQIGFVFQFHHLLGEFSALENVAMPLLVRGEREGRARVAAAELLERVGLGQRMSHRPSELSGGEQQRVAVARALVTRPAVVLADEPTGNLDPMVADSVVGTLVEITKEVGSTLIVVTHSRELAARLELTVEMQVGGALRAVH